MPAEQLDAIEQRANAALPGLWWNDGHEIYVGEPGVPAASMWIGETCVVDLPDYGDANGAFMAHARQDVPALLAEVRRLTAALAAEQTAHESTRATLGSYQLLAPRLQATVESARYETASIGELLTAAQARIAELESLAGRCNNESPRGRRCDWPAGHGGDHQALGGSSVSYVWASQ
jgi:hypothetical protein